MKRHALCFNCLKPEHMLTACKSSCYKHCGRRHHSLLHRFNEVKTNATQASENVNIAFNSVKSHVLLPTAVIQAVRVLHSHAVLSSIKEQKQISSQSLVREN